MTEEYTIDLVLQVPNPNPNTAYSVDRILGGGNELLLKRSTGFSREISYARESLRAARSRLSEVLGRGAFTFSIAKVRFDLDQVLSRLADDVPILYDHLLESSRDMILSNAPEAARHLLLRDIVRSFWSTRGPVLRDDYVARLRHQKRYVDDLVSRHLVSLVRMDGSSGLAPTIRGVISANSIDGDDLVALVDQLLPTLQDLAARRNDENLNVVDIARTANVDANGVPLALHLLAQVAPTPFVAMEMATNGLPAEVRLGESVFELPPGLRAYQADATNDSLGSLQEVNMAETVDPRKVFVVHGRNAGARKAVFDFLRAIGLAPIEWTQATASTRAASPYVGQILDAAFSTAQAVVVVMTGDDEARLRPQFIAGDDPPHEKNLTPQARPNVLFEAGMAFGSHPEQTVLVEIGEIRPFSDVGGRHVVRLSNATERRQDLAQRLIRAGCQVDLTGTDWHQAGDFEAALKVTTQTPPAVESSEDQLDDLELKLLAYLAESESATAEQASYYLKCSKQKSRYHLENLEERKMIHAQHFVGRPSSYLLSKKGRALLAERDML